MSRRSRRPGVHKNKKRSTEEKRSAAVGIISGKKKTARVSVTGKGPVRLCSRPGGRGRRSSWNAEELLTCTFITYVYSTFVHLAGKKRLRFSSFRCKAEVMKKKKAGSGAPVVTRLKIRPEITISSNKQAGRALEVAGLIDKHLPLGNYTQCDISYEPAIRVKT